MVSSLFFLPFKSLYMKNHFKNKIYIMEKIKNQSNWLKTENSFTCVPGSTCILSELPKGIYNLVQNPRTLEFSLERLYDSFEFPFEMYDLEEGFISHVLKTFENTTSNLGILLNGVKGTGKTVTAKILATKMNLPVIIISSPFEGGLSDYLGSLDSECILFFDEFEKNFPGAENSSLLLSVMDGVYNTRTRKVFILTTNKTTIDENFLSRPSRIRYKKSFGNLPIEVVKSYLEKNLHDQSQTNSVISWVNTLANSTIDILKCIVDELNLHKCPVDDIKGFMNLQTAKHFYKSIYSYTCNSKEEFLELLRKAEMAVESGEKDDSGNPYVDISDYPGLSETTFTTNVSVTSMFQGECVDYGELVEPCGPDNILAINYSGEIRYHKILNPDTRPSLYGRSLVL